MGRFVWIHAALLGTWAVVHAPSLGWLLRAWRGADGTLHTVVAGLLMLAVATTTDWRAVAGRLQAPPTLRTLPMLVATVPPLVAAAAAPWVPTNLIGAMAAGLSAYGVFGLFVPPQRWRGLLGPALLALAVLPVSGHLDVLLGFPLRQLTAGAVAWALGTGMPTETVLAIDGGFAHVDLPCSGVRSLWSGAVVVWAAGVAWNRPLVRALSATLLALPLLVLANGARVLVLVVVQPVAPLLAEVLHTPIGVLGFMLALAGPLAVVWGVDGRPSRGAIAAGPERSWPFPAAAALVACWLAVLPLRALPPAPVAHSPVPVLPADWASLPTTDAELHFVSRHGGSLVKGQHDGMLALLVSSRSWLAHHVPEQCHEASGWTLSGDTAVPIDGHLVRWSRAQRDGVDATALWWFQSAERRTDDHTERIRAGISSDAPWVLVSMLVPGHPEPRDPAVVEAVASLAASAARTLEQP